MRTFPSRHCLRLAAGVAVTLLGLGVFAPAARAGCGHLVPLLAQSDRGPAGFALDHSGAPAGLPVPCQGPQCSRQPEVPPLAPVVPPTVPAQEWACLWARPVLRSAEEFALLSDDPVPPPTFRAGSIFHPPRRVRDPLARLVAA